MATISSQFRESFHMMATYISEDSDIFHVVNGPVIT